MLMPPRRAAASYRARRVLLPDGRSVTLRAIRESDAAEIVQAFERLSADSRYLRFMQHKRAIDPAQLHRGVRPEQGREFAFVATVPADDGIDIVGAARYVPAPDEGSCEFAITVGEDWRGARLSDRLLASLMRRARRDGYRIFEGLVLAANAPMLALARRARLNIEPQPDEPTVMRVWRDLRVPPSRRATRRKRAP